MSVAEEHDENGDLIRTSGGNPCVVVRGRGFRTKAAGRASGPTAAAKGRNPASRAIAKGNHPNRTAKWGAAGETHGSRGSRNRPDQTRRSPHPQRSHTDRKSAV